MNCKFKETGFKNRLFDKDLYEIKVIPKGNIKGAVVVMPSLNRQIGSYAQLMQALAENGYLALGIDPIGSGNSSMTEWEAKCIDEFIGDKLTLPGKSYPTYIFNKLILDDYARLIMKTKLSIGKLPLFLLGDGIGGEASKILSAKMQNEISGIVISGIFNYGLRESLIQKYAQHCCNSYGSNCPIKSPNCLAKSCFSLGKKPSSSNSSLDNAFSPKTYTSLRDCLSLSRLGSKRNTINKMDKMLSILILTGKNDSYGKFGDYGKSLYGYLYRNGFADITLRIKENCSHNIFTPQNSKELGEEIAIWLDDSIEIKANL